jgi:hypothetical protein
MKECPTCNNYVKLWDEHSVYCDEPGTGGQSTCDGKDWTQFLESNSWNHDIYGSDNNGKNLEIVKAALIERNIPNLAHFLGLGIFLSIKAAFTISRFLPLLSLP